MTLPPRKPTFRRWTRLAGTRRTLLRGLQYECLEGIVLKGRVLDVGGGEEADYRDLLRVTGTVESVNADVSMHPTYTADLNAPLPIPSGSYDTVLSLNTLEHVWNDRLALSELHRVLRPGGALHLLVPFLFRVHGSPSDFHRHTATAWEQMLTEAGFAREAILVEALAFGALPAAYSVAELLIPPPLRWPIKQAAMLAAWTRLDAVRYLGRRGDVEWDLPLGYYVRASRPEGGASTGAGTP